MNLITFFTAIALSAVAAYYSVIGLAQIFPGSFLPIVIMGSVLEASKLVTVSWLYRNWKQCPLLMRTYLTSACIVLMIITSMGIFGYLSKTHLEHSSDFAPLANKILLIDEKIKVEKENIENNRKTLNQLNEAVDQIMARSTDEKGADKSVAIRKSQQKERSRLSSEIEISQKKINDLVEEKTPMSIELQKAESDFGPIKYVAELIYGSNEKDIIDKAVRLVIILIMVVFDPLAVLLLIAANMSLKVQSEKKSEPTDGDGKITPKEESVEIQKENIVVVEEPQVEEEPTIKKRGFPKRKTKTDLKLEPNYDYNATYSFHEKENTK